MRALAPADAREARALVEDRLGGTAYLARALEQLEDPECHGLVSTSDGAIVGLLLYGEVSGAAGVLKVHWLIGDAGECVEELPPARLMVAEVAEDPIFAPAISALTSEGFVIEGGVDAYFTERVGLAILVKR